MTDNIELPPQARYISASPEISEIHNYGVACYEAGFRASQAPAPVDRVHAFGLAVSEGLRRGMTLDEAEKFAESAVTVEVSRLSDDEAPIDQRWYIDHSPPMASTPVGGESK